MSEDDDKIVPITNGKRFDLGELVLPAQPVEEVLPYARLLQGVNMRLEIGQTDFQLCLPDPATLMEIMFAREEDTRLAVDRRGSTRTRIISVFFFDLDPTSPELWHRHFTFRPMGDAFRSAVPVRCVRTALLDDGRQQVLMGLFEKQVPWKLRVPTALQLAAHGCPEWAKITEAERVALTEQATARLPDVIERARTRFGEVQV